MAVFSIDTFAFERYIGGPSNPDVREPGLFSAPTNVATDAKGNVYVTDTWNHRVQIFDHKGKFVRAFGSHGLSPGQFIRPKGIAVDSEGHIYVADAEFNNFQVFSSDGKVLLAVGARYNPGQFALIAGLFIERTGSLPPNRTRGGCRSSSTSRKQRPLWARRSNYRNSADLSHPAAIENN